METELIRENMQILLENYNLKYWYIEDNTLYFEFENGKQEELYLDEYQDFNKLLEDVIKLVDYKEE